LHSSIRWGEDNDNEQEEEIEGFGKQGNQLDEA
jgi:hypothetical protein